MAVKWKSYPLEECMSAIIDYRGKTPKKTESGIPLITAKVVKSGRIAKPEEFIAATEYESWMRRGHPEAGDVVLTTEAPLGEVAQLGSERVALAQRLICLRGRPDVLDNGFLKYLLQSEPVQSQLRARATGTTVLGIKQSELRKVVLTLPPVAHQHGIATILGALDDKVELNRRLAETLESIARALFKSWFLDFEPVRGKAEEREPVLPERIARLFPSRLVTTDDGERPEGWAVVPLQDIVELLRHSEDPQDFSERAYLHFSLPAYDEANSPTSELGASIKSIKTRVPPGSVLLSKLNPEIERVWLVDVPAEAHAVCSTEFLVMKPRPPFGRSYIYCLTNSQGFRQKLMSLVSGTSKSHQRAQTGSILQLATVRPSEPLVHAFETISEPLMSRALLCRRESQTLAALRDVLLPKLISGELRPSGFESVGETV